MVSEIFNLSAAEYTMTDRKREGLMQITKEVKVPDISTTIKYYQK
jgi:hypothetical protein